MPTVVIVDDSKFIVEKLERFFINEMKWKVLATGSNGNQAVELYRKYRPNLLTCDLSMPEKRGEQAIKEILDEFPDAKVLVITAIVINDLIKSLSHGAAGYAEKPLRFDDSEYVAEFKKTLSEAMQSNT